MFRWKLEYDFLNLSKNIPEMREWSQFKESLISLKELKFEKYALMRDSCG